MGFHVNEGGPLYDRYTGHPMVFKNIDRLPVPSQPNALILDDRSTVTYFPPNRRASLRFNIAIPSPVK